MQAKLNNVQIVQINPQENVQGNNGSFQVRSFVVSWMTEGQFAKQVFREISAFNKTCQMLDAHQVNDYVDVEITLSGTPYTDKKTGQRKIFNKDNVKSIFRAGQGAQQQQAPQEVQQNQNFQGQQGNPSSNDRSGWDNSMDNSQDLPF